MLKKSLPRLSAAMAATALVSALSDRMARGDSFFDQIGMTQLRAEVPSLTGSGVIVAQPEATTMDADTGFDHDNYQVSASTAGVTAPISYIGKSGATSFDSSLVSGHANVVAQYLASSTQGIAPGIARLVNINANRYANNYVLPNNPLPFSPKVINQSFSEDPSGPYTAAVLDQIWDSYAAANNAIIVSAAGNGGAIIHPGAAYNTITVGVYPSGFSSVSSPGDRAKPDIVAPTRMPVDNFSSFTTPIVSGAAALMVQAAGGNNAAGADPRVVKAVLLNGAVKPADWTHSSTVPLDRQYGAGVLNVYNSYKNLTAGQHAAVITTATTVDGVHGAINLPTNSGLAGWNQAVISTTSLTDSVDHYLLDLSTASALTTITTTLDWFRANDPALTTEIKNSNASTSSFTSAINTINNLDLFLYNVNSGAISDLSNSAIDNVEHLYTLNLAPGKYDLQVLKHGGSTGTANVFSNTETYGLAWNTATQSTATNNSSIVFNQTNSVVITTAISGTGSLAQSGAGSTVLTGIYTATGAITVSNGRLAFGATGASRQSPAVLVEAGSLSLDAGTTLDLGNHDALIHSGSSAGYEAKIAAAYHMGNWNLPGITSSTAGSSGGSTTLAVMSGADYNRFSTNAGTFDGMPVLSTDTLIKYTYTGDINLDGLVNIDDLSQFLTAYFGGQTGNYAMGDINYDGLVNIDDLSLFLSNYFLNPSQPLSSDGIAAAPAAGLTGTAAVPEPTSLALFGIGAAGMLVRRKKRASMAA